jgi:predicted O-methyltransferase YrrM
VQPVDFLFLDGAKELYLPVYQLLKPKLSQGAIIFADNADQAGTQSFIDHILESESEFTTVSLFNGRAFLAHGNHLSQ